MLLSQALLICFMVYWLRSEYESEGELLRRELGRQLAKAQDKMTDSAIMLKVVEPAIAAISAGHKPRIFTRIEVNDSSRDRAVTRMFVQKRRRQLSDAIDSQHTKPVSGHTSGTFSARIGDDSVMSEEKFEFTSEEVPKEVFTRSFRLMLEHDSLPTNLFRYLTDTDTGRLAKAFEAGLRDAGMPLTVQWVQTSGGFPAHHLYLSSANTPGYRIRIGREKEYLLGQMAPRLLITLVLLSLTAVAFLVTYKSLRAQMRLAAIRNDFISNMSHELKTPVSTVKVALEAISEPEVLQDLPTARDYIRIATLEMARLELLINQTLQTSLLEEGKVAMQLEPVDLSILVQELTGVMHPRFVQAGASIDTEISGDDFTVSADRLQVQGVIINILDNALKYAGPAPHVRVLISDKDQRVTIAISDEGPGIPAAYRSRIFDKFFRVPRGNEHNVKGYGLGLSYAAQVMKAHGGGISMEPSPGGGCTALLHFKKTSREA